MSIFKPSSWGIIKVIRDVQNYLDFISVIKKEKANKNSNFNKWKLNHNSFYAIYFTMSISDEEAQLPEQIKRLRLIESLTNLHRYLDEDLGFAGSLSPEFNQFYDENNNPTLTYLIIYRFMFDKLSIKWVIKWLSIISLLTFLSIHYKDFILNLF